MTEKLKATFTFVYEYTPKPEHYGTDDIDEMIKIDKEQMAEDPFSFLEQADFSLKIEKVSE